MPDQDQDLLVAPASDCGLFWALDCHQNFNSIAD
jgi:hypothetical protein